MSTEDVLRRAASGLKQVPEDWMPATGTRALVFEDPILVWLGFHGEASGFQRDTSPYDFTQFIFEKGRLFEKKWISEMAPEAVRVCEEAWEGRQVRAVRRTLELIDEEAPVIAAPALWWAPERVYGVPDLIALGAWVRERFPSVELGPGTDTHYVVLDVKFTTKLDSSRKKTDRVNYAAQVRLYSYMLRMLTGVMPSQAFIVCRDRIDDPVPVDTTSGASGQLDSDLSTMRDRYLDIKLNGASFKPGSDRRIELDLGNQGDAPWHSAKVHIARDLTPGGDPCQLYFIGKTQRYQLAEHGYDSLARLLGEDPKAVPLESCKGLGPARCPKIRAILSANRTGAVVPESLSTVPSRRPVELYVDFEFFNNLNVDFERQWPSLEGQEMIFMVGIGWEEKGEWNFEAIIADTENSDGERGLLAQFEAFIQSRTGSQATDGSSLALFHWTRAEVSQLRSACDRHGFVSSHMLRSLPWFDIEEEVFLKEPIGIPGTFKYGLKGVATALELVDWPGSVADGLGAMAAGWQAYEEAVPSESPHMEIIREYNEVDCRALYEVVRWLRSR